jgi:hypothetical protein
MFNGERLPGDKCGRSAIATAVPCLSFQPDEQLEGEISH